MRGQQSLCKAHLSGWLVPAAGIMSLMGGGTAALADEQGQQSDAQARPIEEVITVEAQKAPRALNEIPGVVTAIDAEQIEDTLSRDIKDMVRFEPGISVSNQGSRFGNAGFTIRGISGNRVQIEVDGVSASDGFSIGDFSNASQDFVDVDAVRQVEIVRGPGSALFGSDAIGGVVSFVTKNPADYLRGEPFYFDARAGYYGVDASTVLASTIAGQAGNWSGLVRVTRRDGEEIQNGASDPVDYDSTNVLAKLVRGDAAAGGVMLTAEVFDSGRRTEVESLEGVDDFSDLFGFPYVVENLEVSGDDARSRVRVGLSQQWVEGVGPFDFLRWRAFGQRSETTQRTFQARREDIAGVVSATERLRDFEFEQDLFGLEVTAGNEFLTGGIGHSLVYGVEYEQARTEQLRNGVVTDVATGETSNVIGPDTFPLRDFPNSDTSQLGVYLQYEASFANDRFTLIPAVRWDRYTLDPDPDPTFTDRNPGVTPVDLTLDALSPKLGALWQITDDVQFFANYAEGFRAPPYNDVNVGFTNLQFGYTAIPNPDLRPEESRSVEAGIRYQNRWVSLQAAGYVNRYDDFIQPFQVVDFDPINNLLVFQSVNLSEVSIVGAELSSSWEPAFFPRGLTARFVAAWAEGTNEETDQPINTIDPLNGVFALDYESPNRPFGLSLVTRAAAAQDRLDETDIDLFESSSYVVFDAFAHWQATSRLTLRAAVLNLTDRDYFEYADVRNLAADTANIERFRQPGITGALTIDWRM